MMTIENMKAKIVSNYAAFKAMLELQKNGYDEETAIAWVYNVWFN